MRASSPGHRIFDGKKYKLWGSSSRRDDADEQAEIFRKRGRLVRVVKAPQGSMVEGGILRRAGGGRGVRTMGLKWSIYVRDE